MENSSSFFRNDKCAYFPCHECADPEKFNCLFCFCPFYFAPHCIGHPSILPNGVKACTDCLEPHKPENYDLMMKVLGSLIKSDAAKRLKRMQEMCTSRQESGPKTDVPDGETGSPR